MYKEFDQEISHERLIEGLDSALPRGGYLAGARYTLADAAVTPYMVRDEVIGLAALWSQRPRVVQWFAVVRARPSFDAAVSRVLTDADRERLTVPLEDSARLF